MCDLDPFPKSGHILLITCLKLQNVMSCEFPLRIYILYNHMMMNKLLWT